MTDSGSPLFVGLDIDIYSTDQEGGCHRWEVVTTIGFGITQDQNICHKQFLWIKVSFFRGKKYDHHLKVWNNGEVLSIKWCWPSMACYNYGKGVEIHVLKFNIY